MNWLTLQWMLIRHHLLEPGDTILAAGDPVVVTKAGKKTYGLELCVTRNRCLYLPMNFGLRFSTKERNPSLVSSVS
jgi:hypothetical protein